MVDFASLQAQVYVAVIVEEGSFARAAGKLSLPPPYLARSVGKLEKSLGTKLFKCSTRKLELTDAGQAMIPEAQHLLRHAERAEGLSRYTARKEREPIRVGYLIARSPGASYNGVWFPRGSLVLVDELTAVRQDNLNMGRLDGGNHRRSHARVLQTLGGPALRLC